MSIQPAWFFEHFLSKKRDQNNNAITGPIIGVFILVLLLTVTSFALASMGEQFEEDDLGFLDLGTTNLLLAHFYFAALVLGFELGVFPTILRLEYLKSHIGEKRPASAVIRVNNSSFRVLFPWTALILCRLFVCSVPGFVLRTGLPKSWCEAALPDFVQINIVILFK